MPNSAVSRIDWELPANFSSEAEMEKMYDTTNVRVKMIKPNVFTNLERISKCRWNVRLCLRDSWHCRQYFRHCSLVRSCKRRLSVDFFFFKSMLFKRIFFRHFVANLAIVDILCGFVFVLMGYVNVFDEHNIPTQSVARLRYRWNDMLF